MAFERLRVAGAELEDVADLDRRLDPDRVPVDRVARHHAAHVDGLEAEVAPRLDAAQVRVGRVGPRDVAAARDRPVHEDRRVRAHRADVAGGPDLPRELLLARRPERGAAERVAELDVVDLVVAAHEHQDEPAAVHDHRVRLDQRARGHAERVRHRRHRRLARRVHALGRVQPLQRHGLRLGRGHLDVGRVAGRQRHVVLARRAGRHVLVRADAAHRPHVGLHPVPLQPAAVEDPVVGRAVLLVAHVEPLGVAVERVRVLHDELARPQHTGARARLVAALELEVVEDQRQVAVGAHDLGHVRGHDLLVRQRQHEVRALAVLELEHLVDVVAPGAAPDLRRADERHQHLLRADRVQLLAHDLLHLLVHPPARGHPDHRPVPTWRTSPARTSSLCDSASASAGGCFSVGSRY